MRAVALVPSDGTLRVVDHPAPRLAADTDVMVRMLDIGVCGTDREIARRELQLGAPPPGEQYLIIGHESLGRVIDVGPGVRRVAPGDLVVIMVRRPCPHATCRACRSGRQDFCFTGDFTERGIVGRHGFMTELVVDDERYIHAVPAGLREVGVLVEPLSIAEKALFQVWDVQKRLPWTAPGPNGEPGHGQRAMVLGAGPVGLLGALALLVRGFETLVYSREPASSDRARLVASVGGRYVSSADTPLARLAKEIGAMDLIYEAAGASALAIAALSVLGPNGVFVFTGVPGRKERIEVESDRLIRTTVLHNQLLFGTVNAGPDAFAAAIDELARFQVRWPDSLRALITGRHPPEAAPALLRSPPAGLKDVISFPDGSRAG